MSGNPRWPAEGPGAEALWRAEKGDKGEPAGAGEGMTHGARRAVLALFAAMAVLGAAALGLGARTADHLTRQVQSQCRFDGDLAGLPLSVNPATRKASIIGVKIVSDSRVAWHQAGCPGRLAPPSPSFTRWARFYHLPTG